TRAPGKAMQTSLEQKNEPKSESDKSTATNNGNGHAAAPSHGNGNGNGNGATAFVPAPSKTWTTADSERLYGVRSWGQGYFSVNADGHVAVHPTRDPNLSVDLQKLVHELRERDIQLPMLIRFTDILN